MSEEADAIKEIFRNADANKDGFVSKEELTNILSTLGEWSEEEFAEFFVLADKNKDGRLSYDEFVDWVMNEERVAAIIKPVVFKHIFTQETPGSICDHYTMDRKMLGQGSFGQVSKGEDKVTKVARAIKAIDVSGLTDRTRLEEEVAIQQSLDHPHIVKLYEVFKDARCLYLVMELCTGGELFDRIIDAVETADEDGHAFNEQGAANYMQQMMGAMRYIHSQSFAHRDIKPENFLMQNKNKDAALKVIDFGLAKRFAPGETMSTMAGTPFYVAPEVLEGAHTEKCDIWSCGVMAYILLCGYPPFFGDGDGEILANVKKGAFTFPSPEWDNITPEGKDFITQMLTKDPAKRPSAEVILDHSWLKNHAGKLPGAISKELGTNMKNFRGLTKLKKVALTLVAQQLDEADIEDLKNTFNLLDENRDGTLTMQEIEQGMVKHQVNLPEDMAATLKTLDTDGSGRVDYTEFIASTMNTKLYLKKEVLWSAFRTFDKDGDGLITKAELKSILLSGDPTQKMASLEKQVDQMINECDLDGDGAISFDEFNKLMEKNTGL